MREHILIVDFGSQYTQLIARRVREMNVYSQIQPCTANLFDLIEESTQGIILSGGPSSVYEEDAPIIDKKLFSQKIPILGVCYGMQLMTHLLGGSVLPVETREYGRAKLVIDKEEGIFSEIPSDETVWMSHGDAIDTPPEGFESIAHSQNSKVAAIASKSEKQYGIQFHPEVVHTTFGKQILKNFVSDICGCEPTWTPRSFVEDAIEAIQKKVGNGNVICGLSGGVDSSVTAMLVHRAIGDRLTCVFVDNGCLRKGEADEVVNVFGKELEVNLQFADEKNLFYEKLSGVTDPEKKRKTIGETFIRVFEREAKEIGDVNYLAQGTLYPDVIESVSFKGPSVTIKSHHNVGGLPEHMDLDVLEPLRELFKDEVRSVGKELGLSEKLLWRHPFPGPGLAVRILGEITKERVDILQEADYIFIEELRNSNLYEKVWQAFAVLLPVNTVGVMGDSRTYENARVLRAVTSQDGMTADWAHLPHEFLADVSNRIINEVPGINRVAYDISSKPPATIEWE